MAKLIQSSHLTSLTPLSLSLSLSLSPRLPHHSQTLSNTLQRSESPLLQHCCPSTPALHNSPRAPDHHCPDFVIFELLFIRIIKSVDAALQLSQTNGVHLLELGHALVLFFFSVLIVLIDSTLDDWGLQMTSLDRSSGGVESADCQSMDIDLKESHNLKINEHREQIMRTNSFMAIGVLGKLTESRKAKVLLRLVHLNLMPNLGSIVRYITMKGRVLETIRDRFKMQRVDMTY